jgi:hypothetical protein
MATVLNFLLRLLLLAAGLVFALSLAIFLLLVLALWSLRAAWARLTGRPVMPFVMRVNPLDGFEQMMRRAPQPEASRTPRADAAAGVRRPPGDVTDVEPRETR